MSIYLRTGVCILASYLISIIMMGIYNYMYRLLPFVLIEEFVIWLRIVLGIASMMLSLEFFGTILEAHLLWPWFSTNARDKIVFAIGFGVLLVGNFLIIALRYFPAWFLNFLLLLLIVAVPLGVYNFASPETKARIRGLRNQTGLR